MNPRNDDESFAEAVRETINRLRLPISRSSELLELLSAPLATVGLLPEKYIVHNKTPFPGVPSPNQIRWIPTIQSTILQFVVPSWDMVLAEEFGSSAILELYFCPTQKQSWAGFELALRAYSTLLAFPLSQFAVGMLSSLNVSYPIDELHEYLFPAGAASQAKSRTTDWEELVRTIVAVPSKVANAANQLKLSVPARLQPREYSVGLCHKFENLVAQVSDRMISGAASVHLQSVSHILVKMIQTGNFPIQNTDPFSTSFFNCTFPRIRRRLQEEHSRVYSAAWSSLFLSLPSTGMQTFLGSLVSTLPTAQNPLERTDAASRSVKDNSRLLRDLLGPLRPDQGDMWVAVSSVLISRTWNDQIVRVLVCWASGLIDEREVNEPVLVELATQVLDVWSSTQHSKNLQISRHKYISALLMITLSYFPSTSSYLKEIANSPKFLSSVSKYIGNLDPTIRRIGMAVAEYVAELSNRKLDFGDWDGDTQGRAWIRDIRTLLKHPDGYAEDPAPDSDDEDENHSVSRTTVDYLALSLPSESRRPPKERQTQVHDSDDSLSAYASSSSSSRVPSPTPEELEEIEKDPTLRSGGGLNKKKVTRPVYLADLGELLRPTKAGEQDEYEKLDMGLQHAEELIRRKKDYGTELEENAANLAIILVGLQDNFDLDSFEEKRQGALVALVACSPRISAPCIIEQFFHNQYSTTQRFAMLTALALGARELASLPTTSTATSRSSKPIFPSKMLPTTLHRKYLLAEEVNADPGPVGLLAQDISRSALERGRKEAEDRVPQIIREKQLRIRKPAPSIVDVSAARRGQGAIPFEASDRAQGQTAFKDIAAEYFIIPLIERFWQHLRDEQTRETRFKSRSEYRGAGTGMILDALVLRQILSTLAVLAHAARHSTAFLRILAPEALEVAVTIGTRPVSVVTTTDDEFGETEKAEKEASVLASSLELALVVLDACVDLDGGRELGLEKTMLVLATRDWASEVFRRLEKTGGVEVDKASGDHVNRVRRSATGVLLKIEEVTNRWSRSMISL